jgi:polygalacturonase
MKAHPARFWPAFLPSILAGMGIVVAAHAAPFSVTRFGAAPNETNVATAAIQKAIDAAAAAGGGQVTFPRGLFHTGALFLKSNVELRLDEGVVLRAAQDDAAYPDIWSRVAGVEMDWPAAVINVYGQTNVSITGKGTLDGNGAYWWRKFWGEERKSGMLKDYVARGLRWAVDYDCKRVRALLIYDSKDVAVRDVTIERSGFWSLTMTYSERVTVDGVIIRANIGGHGPSSDGIDVDSSRDVLIQNCDIDANDDNICLKAGRDADGLRVNRPTENVVIRNCITRAGYGMFTIGSETSGGIRNVQVSNMRAIGTKLGIHFKSAKIRGGVVENISIRDVTMENVERPLNFEMNWYPAYSLPTLPPELQHTKNPAHWAVLLQPVLPASRGIPEVRNVSITNLKATGAKIAIAVNGFPDKPIRDVRLANITIEAASAGRINHAADWQLWDVVINAADNRPVSLLNCRSVDAPQLGSPAKRAADSARPPKLSQLDLPQ